MVQITAAFSRKEKIFLWVFFLILYAYLWLRAAWVPFTHDEAATFFFYIQPGNFLPWLSHWDANNHILNSGLSAFFFRIFGSSELSLRLSNLLFFPLFFYYCVRISARLELKSLRLPMIAVLCLTHHFIQFFALSRGYGMSFALLLAALYHIMQLSERHSAKDIWLTLLFIITACMANLTLLPTTVMILAYITLLFFFRIHEQGRLKFLFHTAFAVITGMAFVVVLAKYMFELKKRGCLYYGSSDGFWQVTVRSISFTLTDTNSMIIPIVFAALFLILFAAAAYLFFSTKGMKRFVLPGLLPFWLLSGNIAAIIFLGKVMHVNYPEDRTGFYLYILLVIGLFTVTDKVITQSKRSIFSLAIVPLLFFPLHFLWSANFSDARMITTGRIPSRFLDKVSNDQKPGQMPLLVGGREQRTLCWSYQNYRHKGTLGTVQVWNFLSETEDYQILRKDDFEKVTLYYDSIDYDKNSELYLLKRKSRIVYEPLDTISINSEDHHGSGSEFSNLFSFKTDSLSGRSVLLDFNLNVISPDRPFDARLVATAGNSSGKDIIYANICFNWLKQVYQGNQPNFRQGILLAKLPPDAKIITVYIWNLSRKTFDIKGNCTVSISHENK
ncbi:MAG: hypothetical protein WCM76_14980 [Bacteroidota bacterium]